MSAETSTPKWSFLQRNAFIITITLNSIIESLGGAVFSQYRYRFFHDKHQDQLSSFNVTRSGECGTENLDPEVQKTFVLMVSIRPAVNGHLNLFWAREGEAAREGSWALSSYCWPREKVRCVMSFLNDFMINGQTAIENTISKETQEWSLYQEYAAMLPMLISSILIGMKSDQIGRRFLFFVPFIGSIIIFGHLAVVIKLKLHYGWLLISTFLSSCFGGHFVMMFAVFSMVSDTHGKKKPTSSSSAPTSPTPNDPTIQAKEERKSEEKDDEKKAEEENNDNDMDMSRESSRTFKIVGVEVMTRLASSVTSFVTGYIIQYAGFFYCTVIVLSGKVILLIFAVLYITETGQQKRNEGFRDSFRIIYRALKDPTKKSTLILVNIGIYFFILGMMEEFTVLHTYQMSPPFCLNAIQLGWVASEGRLRGIFSMPLLWLWKRLSFSESTIAAIGVLSYTASGFVLATIRQTWVFYATPVIGIPGTLVSAITKTITTRLIGRAALASTFSVTLAGEQVFIYIGSISANYMYQYFLPTLPTAPFYMGAGFLAVSTLIFIQRNMIQNYFGGRCLNNAGLGH